jgi:hypothetical protein
MKQIMARHTIFIVLTIIVIIVTYPFLLVYYNTEKVWNFVREDGFVENLQVLLDSLAACAFIYLFIKTKSDKNKFLFKTNRNYFFLLLGIFCIIILGEEINWGQRLFSLNTPTWMIEKDMPEDINLHNQGPLFHIFGIPITAARLYFPACIIYFLLIPILNHISKKANYFFNAIHLPIVPVFIAILFLANFSSWQFADQYLYNENKWLAFPGYAYGQTVMEIYEIFFAILLFWSSLSFFSNIKKSKSDQSDNN